MEVKLYTENNEYVTKVTIAPFKKLEPIVILWGARYFKHKYDDIFEEVLLVMPLSE